MVKIELAPTGANVAPDAADAATAAAPAAEAAAAAPAAAEAVAEAAAPAAEAAVASSEGGMLSGVATPKFLTNLTGGGQHQHLALIIAGSIIGLLLLVALFYFLNKMHQEKKALQARKDQRKKAWQNSKSTVNATYGGASRKSFGGNYAHDGHYYEAPMNPQGRTSTASINSNRSAASSKSAASNKSAASSNNSKSSAQTRAASNGLKKGSIGSNSGKTQVYGAVN